MNRKAVVQELLKVARLIEAKQVKVLVYDAETEKKLGTVTLHDYEARHFLNSRSFPAQIALDSEQIDQLGIDPSDKIFFDEG
jgi:hypothetical protein